LLGLIYSIAFASFAVQARGLVGEHGILPAGALFERLHQELGPNGWVHAPTVFWWNSSDATLVTVSWLGAACGLAVAFGLGQGPLLAVSWVLYLSVCTVGQDFFGFQWDSLLSEVGLLAIVLAPWCLRSRWRDARPPPVIPLWLLRVVLFRLMVASAAVKLLRNDPTWLGLTALDYHFWTQPIPSWTSFFAHQTPEWLHQLSCLIMFVIEGIMPFGFFLPRPFRLVAAASQAALQLIILATGNFGYFNLLTLDLCVLLVDDGCIPFRPAAATPPPAMAGGPRRALGVAAWSLAAVWLTLGSFSLSRAFLRPTSPQWLREAIVSPPPPIAWVEQALGPYRVINGYGLFAHMTTERMEITIEGSRDGVTWEPYAFKWKPGDPSRRPAFVQPHMPRLDWQMWFAALGSWRRSPWFRSFLDRLLEGSPEVLALLEHNPFPERPPEQIRARFTDYRFTTLDRWWRTGQWWEAGPEKGYSPTITRPEPVGQR
jgi:hypothetical protein